MSESHRKHHHRRRGFLLLETMLGIAIFSIGVLALARSMQYCLDAEIIRQQDRLARVALENRMEEILANAVAVAGQEEAVALEGRFEGITLRQSREPLVLVDENNAQISGLDTITLQAVWKGPQGELSKEVKFNRISNE